ncbi:MAG: DUF308 domain-containing protein [Candidatus Azobacteroides sp.]|nr:DUF308 domain-containing protein [Candidatus Azobacteroides sp.]
MDYYSIKNWWMLPLIGILFIIGGIFMISKPFASIEAMTLLFSVSFFVWGIFEIIFSFSNMHNQNWGWYLAGGILDLLIGILLLSSSFFSQMEIFAFFMGFWIMFKACSLLGHTFELKHLKYKNWGWLLFLSILAFVLSFLVLAVPALALETLLIFVSISLLFLGTFYVMMGFSVRKIDKSIEVL